MGVIIGGDSSHFLNGNTTQYYPPILSVVIRPTHLAKPVTFAGFVPVFLMVFNGFTILYLAGVQKKKKKC